MKYDNLLCDWLVLFLLVFSFSLGYLVYVFCGIIFYILKMLKNGRDGNYKIERVCFK